ncbi:hypothetical protein E2976_02040 (plasmid) [Paracoccus yeei]|uniref:hypothetical protein n=1 Tax=Paracoccus yeei TaxID=147645 RepID=UPI003BF8D55D
MTRMERPRQIQMPSELKPEMLSDAEDLKSFAGLPFYISDYVDDAGDRLKAVIPLSVRDRKPILPELQACDPSLDLHDQDGSYQALLDILEEQPSRFQRFHSAINETLPQAKKDRAPFTRVIAHLVRTTKPPAAPAKPKYPVKKAPTSAPPVKSPPLVKALLEKYRNAASDEERKMALFNLFLEHLIVSSTEFSGQALPGHIDPDVKTEDPAQEAVSSATETEPVVATLSREDLTETILNEAKSDLEPQPIPEVLAARWRNVCADIELLALEMNENLEASGLPTLLARIRDLEALAIEAAEIRSHVEDPARQAALDVLGHLLSEDDLAEVTPFLEQHGSTGLEAVARLAQGLRDQSLGLKASTKEVNNLEARIKALAEAKDFLGVATISADYKPLFSARDVSHEVARGEAAELALHLGRDVVVSIDGTVTLGRAREPKDQEDMNVQSEPDDDDPIDPCPVDEPSTNEVDNGIEGVADTMKAAEYILGAAPETKAVWPGLEVSVPALVDEPVADQVAQDASTPPHGKAEPPKRVAKVQTSTPSFIGGASVTPAALDEAHASHPEAEVPSPEEPSAEEIEAALVRLLREDRTAIAARFGLALDRRHVPSPIPTAALQAAAASRLSFEAYDSNVQHFSQILGAATAANLNGADEEPRSVLVFGSLLRAAISMPELQSRQILGDLNLRSYGRILSDLQEALAELEYGFAPKLDDLAKNVGRPKATRLDLAKRELKEWHEQAKVRTGPCQPSSRILNRMVTSGDFGRILERIQGNQIDLVEIDQIIRDNADDALVEAQAYEINRQAFASAKKTMLAQDSMRYIKKIMREGVNLLIRFRDLSKHSRTISTKEIDQLPRRVATLQSKVRAAGKKLVDEGLAESPGLSGATATWLSRRLDDLDRILSGQEVPACPDLETALGEELDLLPVGCQPTSAEALCADLLSRRPAPLSSISPFEDELVVTAVLEDRVLDPKDALEEKIRAGAFASALRIARRSANGEAELSRLVTRIRGERRSRLEAFKREVSDVSRRLKDLIKIDLNFQDEILRTVDRLDTTTKSIQSWQADSSGTTDNLDGLKDLVQIPHLRDEAEALIQRVQEQIREDQRKRLAHIEANPPAGTSADTRGDIARLRAEIDALSPDVIEDRLAFIRDGRPLGEIRHQEGRPFETFFPGFAAAAACPGWPANPEAYAEALAGEQHSLLRLTSDRRAAASDLINAWFKVVRQLGNGTQPAALRALLEALTFNVIRVSEGEKVTGIKHGSVHSLRMNVPAKDFFCPPAFGSKSGGSYMFVAISANVLFEQIADQLKDNQATLLLVAECMSVEKRREFAQGLRDRNIPAILIDEALIAFLAVSTTPRLRTLFDCALPFGRFESYTTSAGKLPPEMFFGRQQEISLIMSQESDGCLVYGGRQLGKSALLAHVCELYHNKGKDFIVQWEPVKSLGAVNNPAGNIWAVIGKKLEEFGIVPSRTTAQETVVQSIRRWLSDDPTRRIILLLDETDNFMSAEARNGYMNLVPLKSLMEETFKRFKVVFAGLHNVRRMLEAPNSPLAHLGKPICIGPLNTSRNDKESAEALVIEPMRAAGFVFQNPAAVDQILAYVNHYPSLVQTFCKGLLEHLRRQGSTLGEGPHWQIPNEMLSKGEGFDSISKEIRDKFQLTLDLDPRYALIANVMGLILAERGEEQVLHSGMTADQIREETLKHWPEQIEQVGHAGFKALIEELSELGVLSRIASSDGSARFVLRTRQVAQMLGQEQEIVEALVHLHEREAEVDYDPSSYRKPYEPNGEVKRDGSDIRRSPLSDGQIQNLLDPERPGCHFVAGLPIMGLREVPVAIEKILAAAGNRWDKMTQVTCTVIANDRELRREVDNSKVTKGMSQVRLLFVQARAEDIHKIIAYAEKQPPVRSGDLRPVFLLDPSVEVLRDIAVQRQALILTPWGHEMLRAYLQEVEANALDTPDLRREILKLTGGIPQYIGQLARKNANRQGRITPTSIYPGFDPTEAKAYLPASPHREVLGLLEDVDDLGTYYTLLEILASDGIRNVVDIITDLQVLGFVQALDHEAGRITLSAFGRFSQAGSGSKSHS